MACRLDVCVVRATIGEVTLTRNLMTQGKRFQFVQYIVHIACNVSLLHHCSRRISHCIVNSVIL